MMMKGKQRKDRDRRRVVQGVACAILAVVFLAVVFWPSERKDASRPKAENQPLRYAGASRVVEKDSEEELKEPPKGALAELKEHIKTAEPPRYAFPNEPPTTKQRSDEEESANESQQKVSSKDKKALNIVPIPRFKAGELSVHDFFAQNEGKLPIIVEGEVLDHLATKMSFEDLRDLCGGGLTETSKYEAKAHEWAGLSDLKVRTMKEYLETYILNKTSDELVYSSGSVGIPEFCPKLEFFTPVPSYVSLGVVPIDPYKVQPGQPEMYIGPPGTKTELHMDGYLISFWMSVYKGSKTFRIIPFDEIYENERMKSLFIDKKETNRLEKVVSRNRTTGKPIKKELEIWNPDLDVFPELLDATVYEGAVNAGDWIYLPGGALHGVSNDGYSWGVSINSMLPASVKNFADVCLKAQFKWDCRQFAEQLSPACKELGDLNATTADDLVSCLMKGELMKKASALYDSYASKDSYLHEAFHFPNFKSWCEATCQSLRTRFEIQKMQYKGFEDFKTYYKEKFHKEIKDLSLSEFFPIEQVEYVCGQCKAQSELDQILYKVL